MSKVNPRVDLVFKKLFGVEENKDLLISLINATVGSADQIDDVELLNPYNLKNFPKDKLSILDIKARGLDGKLFNIEIQITDESAYDKRALYYWSKLYTGQLQSSENYSNLSKTIGIHILNFTSIPCIDAYHNVFHIVEQNSGLPYFQDFELHTIELTKFSGNSKAPLSETLFKVKNSLDRWVTFFTRNDVLDADNLPPLLADPLLKKALDVLHIMNLSKEEQDAYEGRLKWLRMEADILQKYEQKWRQEGIQIGEEKGIKKGGREEKLSIARGMLHKGYKLEDIMDITGLPKITINKLYKEL